MGQSETRAASDEPRRFDTMLDALNELSDRCGYNYDGPVPAVLMQRPSFADFESHNGQQLNHFATITDGRRLYAAEDGSMALWASESSEGVFGGYVSKSLY